MKISDSRFCALCRRDGEEKKVEKVVEDDGEFCGIKTS
jgi:hypothetical protein